MPSLRSHILNAIIRRTAKRRIGAVAVNPITVAAMRARLDAFGAGHTPPAAQRRETGDLGGVRTEFTRVHQPLGTIYYCHGGGYIMGSPVAYRRFASRLARATGHDVAVIDYRLAPEHPFPAAPDDALAGYRALIDGGAEGEDIVIAGDSAGGNLALVTLLRIKQAGLPLPAGGVLLSPWTDLTGSGESVQRNDADDPMLPASRIVEAAQLYAGNQALNHPHVSPLFGDLAGLPPLALHVGSTEILLSDSTRLVERVRSQGGRADIRVWRNMPHVFPMFADVLPEGRRAIGYIAEFIAGVRT
jgi:acetyl esterase/lipase